MARDAAAWRWYASMNDDVRHHLIERGWFEQKQPDPAFERDVLAMQTGAEPAPELDPEFDAGADEYGFYGDVREDEAELADFYGEPDAGIYDTQQPEPEQ